MSQVKDLTISLSYDEPFLISVSLELKYRLWMTNSQFSLILIFVVHSLYFLDCSGVYKSEHTVVQLELYFVSE